MTALWLVCQNWFVAAQRAHSIKVCFVYVLLVTVSFLLVITCSAMVVTLCCIFIVIIDGTEWTDVKFFSVSPAWSKSIQFPLGMCSPSFSSHRPVETQC